MGKLDQIREPPSPRTPHVIHACLHRMVPWLQFNTGIVRYKRWLELPPKALVFLHEIVHLALSHPDAFTVQSGPEMLRRWEAVHLRKLVEDRRQRRVLAHIRLSKLVLRSRLVAIAWPLQCLSWLFWLIRQ